MLKKSVMAAAVVAGLMSTSAWAAGAITCVVITHPNNGTAIKNICNKPVEASWGTGSGKLDNAWTIQPGQEMPIDAKPGEYVRYDACEGANSIKRWTSYGTVECR